MKETPTILTSNRSSSAINPQMLFCQNAENQYGVNTIWETTISDQINQLQQIQHVQNMPNQNRRIVQVFIADPNDNVPLESAILYQGEQKLTDLTDTELFFEVPIMEKLTQHNSKRVTWIDKDATKRAGKDIVLDPAKIRDLKMVVVTVAQL